MQQLFRGCEFFAAPIFSVSERGLFSWIVHTGSGGMEFQVTLCSAAARFLSQLTSWLFAAVLWQKDNLRVQAVSLLSSPLTLAMVLGVSLSAAVLQDSLPSTPRFPRFPQSKPPVASPPTVMWLWMPEAELILVDV